MTDKEINEIIAKGIWKPKDGGWIVYTSGGYSWHRDLPVEPYCTDSQLAMKLLEGHKDFGVDKQNGSFYRVTLYVPSYEFVGEGTTFAMAVANAFVGFYRRKLDE